MHCKILKPQSMLIQITNQCDNNCPHCLHNSVINGGHMTMEVFEKALALADEMDTWNICISGGEPFFHPQLYEICSKINRPFTICSNGNFIKNPFLKRMALTITKLPHYLGLQITAIQNLYPNYWDIRKHWKEFDEFPRVFKCLDVPIYIKNLGRGQNFPVNKTYPGPSCVNSHLLVRQSLNLKDFGCKLNENGIYCHPLVDWQGNIHHSESWLCPCIGNVDTPYNILYQKLKDTPPCKKCKNWKVFEQMNKYHKAIEMLK